MLLIANVERGREVDYNEEFIIVYSDSSEDEDEDHGF